MPYFRGRTSRRFGFTLVELLVVIGIIGLLISILLPTLNRAREQARKVKCLSNLRSLGQLVQMYANASKGLIPIGVSSSTSSFSAYSANYYLARKENASTVRYVGLGLLYPAGLLGRSTKADWSATADNDVSEGEVFYCPSTIEDTLHGYDTSENPWISKILTAGVGNSTNASYVTRATDPTSTLPAGQQGICWTSTGPAAHPCAPVNETGAIAKMMNIARMKSRPIVTDVPFRTRIKLAHENGVNVLNADGSARFVHRSMIGDDDTNLANGDLIYNLTVTATAASNARVELYWDRIEKAP